MFNSFKTQITVLQQEGYDMFRFFKWFITHPFTYRISTKKPLVFTQKIRLLIYFSYILFLSSILFSFIEKFYLFVFIDFLIFIFLPFIFLLLSLLLLFPYEKLNRIYTISRIRNFLIHNVELTTIGITGSYGKTSVKDFLFCILSGWKETLKTPESYNTIFGIAKVVDFELLSKTRIFICEMGAYVRGEISELCRMVPPQYAILTAIGTQHLERFKNIENTTLAKFELIDSVITSNALVNLDNFYISKHLSESQYRGVKTYSITNPSADFYVSSYKLTPTGLKFELNHQKKKYLFNSSLFGTSNLYNLTAAISMALMLKVPENLITKQVSTITPSPHRLELKKINHATLIDNAFSSNEEGFTTLIADLSGLKGKKVLITPGIIELGKRTSEVHEKLGKLASPVFDKFILVGKSERTENLEKGISKKVTYIENSTDLWPLINELSQEYDWILLENDLPDTF